MAQIRYKIEYTAHAIEQLAKLPKTMRERVAKAIDQRLTLVPSEIGKPLVKEWKDHRRLRIGDYRVIYKVFEEMIVVFIVEIDHRKNVYEK